MKPFNLEDATSIQISERDHYNAGILNIPKSEFIKFGDNKRMWCKLISVDTNTMYEHKLTMRCFYKPSPKSRLKNKGVFSKFKMRTIK